MPLWTLEEDQIIKNACIAGATFDSISHLVGNRNRFVISRRAQSLGVRSRFKPKCKYNFDRQYFDVLTPENCYWGGIMQTDGHVNKRGNQCYIKWGCSRKDRHHIELFKSMTKAEQPIKDIMKNCQLSTVDKMTKKHEYSYISFESAKPWTDALERHFGITINKTLRSRMPNLPTNLLRLSFMRGMMDGDGHVTVGDYRGAASLGICGSNREVILWFKQVVDSLHLPTLSYRPQNLMRPEGESCYYWRISGLSASILFELFRRLPTPGLARKWEDPRLLDISTYWKSRVDLWPPNIFFDNILSS